MFGMVSGGKEVLKLFDTEHAGQVLWGGARGQVELDGAPAQGVDMEKPDGGRHDVTRTPRQLAVGKQMVEIASNLPRGELIGGTLVVGSQARDGLHILILGTRGFAVKLHLLDHFGTSW